MENENNVIEHFEDTPSDVSDIKAIVTVLVVLVLIQTLLFGTAVFMMFVRGN